MGSRLLRPERARALRRGLGKGLAGLLLLSAGASAQSPADRYGMEPAERGDALLERVALRLHNQARSRVGAPPLAWSDALAREADGYAREMARTGSFRHSAKAGRSSYQGENLWMGTRDLYDYATIIGTFLEEARYYRPGSRMPNISTTGNWRDAGHYTQVIWRRTTALGCALESGRNYDYLVCRYAPPGNVFGQGPED